MLDIRTLERRALRQGSATVRLTHCQIPTKLVVTPAAYVVKARSTVGLSITKPHAITLLRIEDTWRARGLNWQAHETKIPADTINRIKRLDTYLSANDDGSVTTKRLREALSDWMIVRNLRQADEVEGPGVPNPERDF